MKNEPTHKVRRSAVNTSVIVPAYMEGKLLETNIPIIHKELEKLGEKFEIIVSAEGRDNTPDIMNALMKKYKNLKFVYSEKRLGKGGGIENGLTQANGVFIIFMDADLSVNPSYTKNVLQLLENYDIVVASRYNPVSRIKRSKTRAFLGASYSVFVRIILRTGVRDNQCGFKGFRREVLENIVGKVKNKGWFWDTEVLFRARKADYTTAEFPISWYEREESNVHVVDNIFEMFFAVTKLYFKSLFRKNS